MVLGQGEEGPKGKEGISFCSMVHWHCPTPVELQVFNPLNLPRPFLPSFPFSLCSTLPTMTEFLETFFAGTLAVRRDGSVGLMVVSDVVVVVCLCV